MKQNNQVVTAQFHSQKRIKAFSKKKVTERGNWGQRFIFADRHSIVLANAFAHRRCLHFFPW